MPAQKPRLLKWINQQIITGSYPKLTRLEGTRDSAAVAKVQGKWLFRVTTKDHGSDLMITDGTVKGTRILDVIPGSKSVFPTRFRSTRDGKKCFFVSGQQTSVGQELWVTDGTRAGTYLVKDINKSFPGGDPKYLAAIGSSSIVFSAEDPVNGRELWISDGTAKGTRILAGITKPLRRGMYPKHMTATADGKRVFFSAQSLGREELYVTDGTTAGTKVVRQLDANSGSSPRQFQPFGASGMLFVAYQSASGRELWRTDGTKTGTVLVKDFTPGAKEDHIQTLFPLNGRNLLMAKTKGFGTEFFTTDGTAAGTRMVKDLAPGSSSISFVYIQKDGDGRHAYFSTGTKIFVTDATAAGTRQYMPYTLPLSTVPPEICSLGKYVFFPGSFLSPRKGIQMYVTDGTKAGTRSLGNLRPNTSSWPRELVSLDNNRIMFQADGGKCGVEPWIYNLAKNRFDVAPLETSKTYGNSSADVRSLTLLEDRVLFRADDGLLGSELWVTDGSASGTRMVSDLWPGKLGSEPSALFPFGDKVLFRARTPAAGNELWISNGTQAGTFLLKDIHAGSGSSDPGSFARFGNHVWFSADDGKKGRELWITDGTAAGTSLFLDIVPGAGSSSPGSLSGRPGKVFFSAYRTNGQDRELWVSDGTSKGTHLIKDLNAGKNSSNPYFPVYMPNRDGILFGARGSAGFYAQIFFSDGTEKGTKPLSSDYGNPIGHSPSMWTFEPRLGKVLFGARGLLTGNELYETDGTIVGTRFIKDLWPGYGSGLAGWFYTLGTATYMTANDSVHGRELWRLDPSGEDLAMVKDYLPGKGLGAWWIQGRVGSHRLLVMAYTPAEGREYHIYDVDTGNDQVLDFAAGKTSSGVANGRIWHDQLLMTLSIGGMSEALYSFPLGAVSQPYGASSSENWLDTQDPVLGRPVRIMAGSAQQNLAHVVFLGQFHPGQPVQSRYLSYVDLLKPWLILGLGAGKEISFQVPIPNHGSLLGKRFSLQTWSFDPQNLGGTLQLSSGRLWTMGK